MKARMLYGMTSGACSLSTMQLPEYEVYNNDIRTLVQEGTVFQSEAYLYATTKPVGFPLDHHVRSSANIHAGGLGESPAKSIGLFEVVQLQTNDKFIIKVFDRDEAHSYQNEVEKLQLLNRIMDE